MVILCPENQRPLCRVEVSCYMEVFTTNCARKGADTKRAGRSLRGQSRQCMPCLCFPVLFGILQPCPSTLL